MSQFHPTGYPGKALAGQPIKPSVIWMESDGSCLLLKWSRPNGPRPRCANTSSVLAAAALAGHGLAWLPTYLVGEALWSGRLVTMLDDYAASPFTMRALYPHNRHLSAKVRVFVDSSPSALAAILSGIAKGVPRTDSGAESPLVRRCLLAIFIALGRRAAYRGGIVSFPPTRRFG